MDIRESLSLFLTLIIPRRVYYKGEGGENISTFPLTQVLVRVIEFLALIFICPCEISLTVVILYTYYRYLRNIRPRHSALIFNYLVSLLV